MVLSKETRKQEKERIKNSIQVTYASSRLKNYEVGKYLVVFDKENLTRPWSCTCVYGSLYRGDKKEVCKHIKITKMRIQEEKTFDWRSKQ